MKLIIALSIVTFIYVASLDGLSGKTWSEVILTQVRFLQIHIVFDLRWQDSMITSSNGNIFRATGHLWKNSLAANPAKFQTMLVKSNNIKDAELNVTVDNVYLPSSDAMKVLGIDIDDRLNFDGHVSNMCIKAGRQFNALQRLKGHLIKIAAWRYIRVLLCRILITVPSFGCSLARHRFLN